MLKLILGVAGTGKTAMITGKIKAQVAAKKGGSLLIVPEQYSHEAERELCAVCGDSLCLYAEVLSFSRLGVRVAQEAGTGGRVLLDKGGRLLCMALALSQIAHRLKLYPGAGRRAELQASLLAAVDELKAAGVDEAALLSAAEGSPPGLSDKLSDLALCMAAYEAVLSHGHADPVDKMRRLALDIGKSSIVNGCIYIDGFTDFTGAEIAVIDALLSRDAQLTVCLTCDSINGDNEHFEPARKAARLLLRLADKHGVKSEVMLCPPSGDKNAALSFFNEHLFNYTSQVFEDKDESVKFFRCDSMRTECELAAAHCIELIRDKGCRLRDIALAVRGFDEYAPTLEAVFSRYGVPLFTAQRRSILQKSLPSLITRAYSIITGGWDTEDVLAYLKTGLTGISVQDADELSAYALTWGIRGSAWTKDGSWAQHPDGLSAVFDDTSLNRLSRIDTTRRQLTAPLSELSKKSRGAETASMQVTALSDFFAALQLPQTLEGRTNTLLNCGLSLMAAEYAQLWDILVNAMEQFSSLLGDMPMTREEFIGLFTRMLSQYEVSAIPVSNDSVSAGDMDRMRRRNIKHLIILGASDDTIPQISSSHGIFSSDEREALGELGIDIGGVDELSRELSLIYNCVSLPSESLTLSYPAFDGSGAQTRPSLLINRAKLLFGREEKSFDVSSARLNAPIPALMLAADAAGNSKAARLSREYFSSYEEGKKHLDELSSRCSAQRGSLSTETVTALYGEKLRLSPSRTDCFASCKLSYFLRYGLRLKKQEQAAFNPPELGTFMHFVLEGVAGDISRSVGFKNAESGLVSALCDKYTDLYITQRLGGFEDKSQRFIYLFERQRPAVRRVVSDMVEELSRSDFAPLDFELSFGGSGELPPVTFSDGSSELSVNGIADRVDGCFRDGKLYLRVIDYKTGKKSFDLSDIWNGIGLQMLLYLFALEQEGAPRYGAEIVPAGVLYVPARDALISAPTNIDDEALSSLRAKSLRRSGLILNDSEIIEAMEHGDCHRFIPVEYKKDGSPKEDSLASRERFEELSGHVKGKMLELSRQLSGGCISPDPLYKGEYDDPCRYCPYSSICRFDEDTDKRRYPPRLKPEEFWSKLEAEK